MSIGSGDPLPASPSGQDALLQVETAVGATIVETPATSPTVANGSIPGVGLMPAPGHLALPFPNPGPQILTQYLFGR